MKKSFTIVSVIFFIFWAQLVSAASIVHLLYYSDHRLSWDQTPKHTIWTGVELIDFEPPAELFLTVNGTTKQVPLTHFFYDESNLQFNATEALNLLPEQFNDAHAIFSLRDEGFPDIDINWFASGFRSIQLMNNLTVAIEGNNPTIAWTDPGGANFHTYRVRVFDSRDDKVYDTPNISYSHLGGANGSFLFDLNGRDIGGKFVKGFTFSSGEDYTIRIEAREWLAYADPPNPLPDGGLTINDVFYLNRSVTEVEYTVPYSPIDEDTDGDRDGRDLAFFAQQLAIGTALVTIEQIAAEFGAGNPT